jgi:hypothetical protein
MQYRVISGDRDVIQFELAVLASSYFQNRFCLLNDEAASDCVSLLVE